MSLDAPTRPSSPAADPAPEPRRRAFVDRLRPGPGEVVDVVLGAVLAAFGVVGFRSVFAGGEELVVGLPGVVLGAAVAYVLVKLKPPIIVGAAIATVTFVVLAGPVALRHRAGAGFLPSADATTGLADGVVNGWIQLLTTLPPAGRSGDLLAIPYLCGYLGAALAVTLALVYPRRSWCVFPPAAVLALSVLMGTKEPASLLLQGFAFAALTIAWVSVRDHRARTGDAAAALPRSRLAAGAALLAVSAIGGVVIGPHLPGANPDERYVLREDVEPPFDPLTEPSPLAGYRNYTDQDVRDDKILTAEGLPKNARLRIATMDRYSGTEWEATGDGSVLAGEYLRVGAEIPAEGYGDEASVSVEIHKPDGVWVPLGGDVTGLAFEGSRAEKLDDEVRVSVETDTAAIPDQLQAGDRYRFTSEFVTVPDRTVLMGAPIDGRYTAEPGEVPPEFVSRGADWARDQPTKYAEMLAVATGLQTEGAYTDGGEEANPVSPPGHGLRRLLEFIELEQPFGNGEQFAAAQGLLAQSRGVPVRVVMGFVNEKGGDSVTYRGSDIEAWIEVPVEGYGWIAIDGTPPEDQLPDPLKQPRSKTDTPEPQPPPPTTIPPPTSIPDELEPEPPEEEEEQEDEAAGLPGWVVVAGIVVGGPILVLGTVALLIVLVKWRRRRRRRERGSPEARVAGSFAELTDFARDTGAPVPARTSRHDVAVLVGAPAARDLAERVDAAAFGPRDTDDADVDGAWTAHDEARRELETDLGRRGRVKAAVNPTSLRRPR